MDIRQYKKIISSNSYDKRITNEAIIELDEIISQELKDILHFSNILEKNKLLSKETLTNVIKIKDDYTII